MTLVAPAPGSRRPAAVLLVALAGGLGLLLLAGPVPQIMYVGDVANYLDGCQRGFLGQCLGRDFTSPIGPAAFFPVIVAMRLGFAGSVQALSAGAALTWTSFGLMGWLVARRRMQPWLAVAFALFVGGTAAAPYPLDFGSWKSLSYGMSYNRHAWGVLSLAAPLALLPRRDGGPSHFPAAALGACAVWLWADKPNYLIVWAALVLCAWNSGAANTDWQRSVRNGLAGGLAAFAVIWLVVPFSPLGYINTHLGMARSVTEDLLVDTLKRSLRENLLPAIALLTVWFSVRERRGERAQKAAPHLSGFGFAALCGAGLAANVTNCQFAEIPLWGALGWIFVEFGLHRARRSVRRLGAIAIAGVLGLCFTWQPLASIAYGFAWKTYASPSHPAAAIASVAWRGMPLRAVPGLDRRVPNPANLVDAATYALWLNDGLALLQKTITPADRVLCVDWSNPFPFATQTTPPRGEDIAWAVGRTIGPLHHPDPARILNDSTIVMEPRVALVPAWQAYKSDLLRQQMNADFVCISESAYWRLWIRRPGAV